MADLERLWLCKCPIGCMGWLAFMPCHDCTGSLARKPAGTATERIIPLEGNFRTSLRICYRPSDEKSTHSCHRLDELTKNRPVYLVLTVNAVCVLFFEVCYALHLQYPTSGA